MSKENSICICNSSPFQPAQYDVWVGVLGGEYPFIEIKQMVRSFYEEFADMQIFCRELGKEIDLLYKANEGALVVVRDRVSSMTYSYVSGEVKEDQDVKFELYKLMGL